MQNQQIPATREGLKIEAEGSFSVDVNGILGVARAVGDHNVGAVNARPKITDYPLSMIPRGRHLILTCDGIYDDPAQGR